MTAADRAYAAIRAALLAGEHEPGARLMEEDLAEALGVSRTPVREALRRLAAEGLVEFVANRGAQVVAWSEQDLREIYGLRALLEGQAARMAADRIDATGVARLRALVTAMDRAARAGDRVAVSEANAEFHRAVWDIAGNRRLAAMVAGLVQTPMVQRTFQRYRPADLRRSLGQHRELVDALEAADPAWAEAVMRSHILAARTVLLGDTAAPQVG